MGKVKKRTQTMKINILILVILINTLTSCGQKKMENRFITWDNFVDNFGKEMVSAEDVFNNMVKSGLKDNCLTKMDFTFISNNKDSLKKLGEFIKTHYPYTVQDVKKYEDIWEINGETNEMPITADNLLYWALDMYKRGYEFDANLDAYGGLFDPKNPKFPDLDKSKEDFYFDKGVECYNHGDLSGAIINWSLTLTINSNEPNSYYSRAIVKNELYTWKSALKDYDKAIEIAPDFISALINRGSLKDDKVLSFEKVDLENKQRTYFNRGNSKFNLADKIGACEDWKKAFELGADYAKVRLDEHCE
jgi:tetratricopeptide (TPR) repeat protein